MVLEMQVSEYAQTFPNKIDYHVYPSGNKDKVIKAFVANNLVFLDSNGKIVTDLDKTSVPNKVRITWCIQKNHQNSQLITLSANKDHPQLCLMCATLQMVL